MADYVTDTHALVWYLEDDKRLGPFATQAYDDCEQGSGFVYVPTICLVELIYLQEKGRIPATLKTKFDQQLETGQSISIVADLTTTVANAIPQIARTDIPELPDRIIAATAFVLQFPSITKDHHIQQSGLSTIWSCKVFWLVRRFPSFARPALPPFQICFFFIPHPTPTAAPRSP